MEKRTLGRVKKRLACELAIDGATHTGLVLDVSPRGLFVQTAATPGPGTPVRVHIRPPSGPVIVVQARVARRRMVPQRLAAVASGGIGLRVESAPEEFFQLLTGPRRAAAAPAEKTPEKNELRFRVRVQQTAGPRSRTLVLAARDAADARARAVANLGAGWSVLEVAPAA